MKKARLLVMIALGSGVVAAVACGGSDTTTNAAAPDGGGTTNPPDASTNAPDTGAASPDGGDDDDSDAATVDEGGSNIDPDAGDDDAGDAGPCNTVTNAAPSLLSTCSSQIPGLVGGPLVAGTYYLTQVAALGPANFCQTQFTPTRIAETLVLTVDATGTGTAQIVTVIANKVAKTNTLTLAPPANNSSPLEETQTCPPKAGAKTIFESELKNQKQLLVIEESYGTGRALYRYEKQ